jgi:formiminoglutamase
MTQPYHDPYWPRANAWLTREGTAPKVGLQRGLLKVLGIPVTLGSITPSSCDLAPQAIRQALSRFSTYDLNHERDLLNLKVEDLGDLPLAKTSVADAKDPIVAAVREALKDATAALVILGGDNSLTRPACLGMEPQIKDCGLLTLDAHLDLRHLENGLLNGNPVRALLEDGLPGTNIVQIGLQSFSNSAAYHQIAKDAGITVVPVESIAAKGIENVVRRALEMLADRCKSIYVDLDLDVMDRVFAPSPGGSRPGGITPLQLRNAAYECGLHPKVRVVDIVELDPTRDVNDVTALAAASCLLSFASGVLGRQETI